jgi:hypothetical protein
MNEERELEEDLFKKLIESQNTLKSILDTTKNIKLDKDRENSFYEISLQIESVISHLKEISEEE